MSLELSLEKFQLLEDNETKFKYLFPFYRMDTMALDHILFNKMKGGPSIFATSYIQDHCCTTPAWKKLWPNLTLLLKMPELKDITFKEFEKFK